jgi:hypothetical protein
MAFPALTRHSVSKVENIPSPFKDWQQPVIDFIAAKAFEAGYRDLFMYSPSEARKDNPGVFISDGNLRRIYRDPFASPEDGRKKAPEEIYMSRSFQAHEVSWILDVGRHTWIPHSLWHKRSDQAAALTKKPVGGIDMNDLVISPAGTSSDVAFEATAALPSGKDIGFIPVITSFSPVKDIFSRPGAR